MSLTVYTGPMFSGKSSYLISRAQNASRVHKVLYVNHSFDNRNAHEVISVHNEFLNVKGDFDAISIFDLSELSSEFLSKYTFLCIDEAQFFGNIVDNVKRFVEEYKLIVVVAGLNGTFERKPFTNSEFLELLCIADDVVVMKDAWCEGCKKERGLFTYKKTSDSSEILIGGASDYMPLCRKCYTNVTCNKPTGF